MAMTPEAKVKASVRKVLDEYEVYYFFPASNGFGRSGIPDIICCVGGKFLAIECKAGRGTITELQGRELSQIASCGGVTMVVNEGAVSAVKVIVEGLLQGNEAKR